ncbi:glutathione S-transferase family protein [Agarilytica rhodophyticola]|uniref:glutathione S-transferase family protein n=1 Tax=Agarilytica rhodophyticola TaxID=1737490 RepID=UPI000B348245|nr:glutathione S-transferase family protein [Agarilytica rhodophyticola]
MITLYGHPISGNSHRVANFLNILGMEYTDKIVDLEKGEHKLPEYLAKNPLGQVPTLTDDDVVLRDSTAILIYLARRYDQSNTWFPEDPVTQAQIQQWLSVAVHEVMIGPFVLRAIQLFGMPADEVQAREKTEKLFNDLFVPHLSDKKWLVGEHPTIADIACYSYIARVTEGNFSLEPYPAIRQWLANVEGIDGFKPMIHANK